MEAGTTETRRLGSGLEASEFRFVPRPDGTAEDVAAVHLPGLVPAGFHGNWARSTV